MKTGATMAPMNPKVKTNKNRDRTSLRLDAEVVAMIDKARIKRVGVVSRNTWIAEAIQEKLAREIGNGAALEQVDQGGS
jgi:metal-responsive CopG/Arc/MetJ family transcriptional regulator